MIHFCGVGVLSWHIIPHLHMDAIVHKPSAGVALQHVLLWALYLYCPCECSCTLVYCDAQCSYRVALLAIWKGIHLGSMASSIELSRPVAVEPPVSCQQGRAVPE